MRYDAHDEHTFVDGMLSEIDTVRQIQGVQAHGHIDVPVAWLVEIVKAHGRLANRVEQIESLLSERVASSEHEQISTRETITRISRDYLAGRITREEYDMLISRAQQ